jgi:hypothetical protein
MKHKKAYFVLLSSFLYATQAGSIWASCWTPAGDRLRHAAARRPYVWQQPNLTLCFVVAGSQPTGPLITYRAGASRARTHTTRTLTQKLRPEGGISKRHASGSTSGK